MQGKGVISYAFESCLEAGYYPLRCASCNLFCTFKLYPPLQVESTPTKSTTKLLPLALRAWRSIALFPHFTSERMHASHFASSGGRTESLHEERGLDLLANARGMDESIHIKKNEGKQQNRREQREPSFVRTCAVVSFIVVEKELGRSFCVMLDSRVCLCDWKNIVHMTPLERPPRPRRNSVGATGPRLPRRDLPLRQTSISFVHVHVAWRFEPPLHVALLFAALVQPCECFSFVECPPFWKAIVRQIGRGRLRKGGRSRVFGGRWRLS